MTTRNEAAERLLAILDDCSPAGLCEPKVAADARDALTAAQEQGAREAVERARTALSAAIDANMLRWLAWDDVSAILDEAANPRESSLGRDTEVVSR